MLLGLVTINSITLSTEPNVAGAAGVNLAAVGGARRTLHVTREDNRMFDGMMRDAGLDLYAVAQDGALPTRLDQELPWVDLTQFSQGLFGYELCEITPTNCRSTLALQYAIRFTRLRIDQVTGLPNSGAGHLPDPGQEVSPVPLPATGLLLFAPLALIAGLRRRARKV